LALGAEGFEEYAGHFWGFLETRPYMRARAGLAIALMKLGEEDAAIDHFRAMLELNPNDNQGVRYLLLGCLLRRDDAAAVKKLLAAYEDEWSAYWLYTRALVAFQDGQGAQQPLADLRHGGRTLVAIDGDAHQLRARPVESGDLRDGGIDVGRIGVRHGLHDDRRPAADDDAADIDGNGSAAWFRIKIGG
jgi:tetratricopeptide (TPR) repeat protein